MDFEFLYSTAADSIEVGDVIRLDNGDVFHVESVTDETTVITLTGVYDDGDDGPVNLDPDETVDILGN